MGALTSPAAILRKLAIIVARSASWISSTRSSALTELLA